MLSSWLALIASVDLHVGEKLRHFMGEDNERKDNSFRGFDGRRSPKRSVQTIDTAEYERDCIRCKFYTKLMYGSGC